MNSTVAVPLPPPASAERKSSAVMDLKLVSRGTTAFQHSEAMLGGLSSEVAARLVAAAGDVAFVLDSDGIVRDFAVSGAELANDNFGDWLDQPWASTVHVDSRNKVTEMLSEAAANTAGRWRQINHVGPGGQTLALRYVAINAGHDGRVIAIGRDLRSAATMQQRLLQAQQSMERDYVRLRQAESRYRLLFDLASEAVLIVDASSSRLVEANPAAQRLLAPGGEALPGQPLVALLADASRDAAVALLGAVASGSGAAPVAVTLARVGMECALSATLFRQEQAAYLLVRLAPSSAGVLTEADPRQMLLDVVERIPDAFVVTDEALDILAENSAFLELAHFARREQARGQGLAQFLGRPGIDLGLIVAHLKEHGAVRNFATVFRTPFDGEDEVEVSAVAVPNGEQPCYGFTIRNVGRRLRDAPAPGRELPRSVEQLTELVGRVSLKEIVRESTDLIERLCIEAALTYTADNRASAAEILGLSRQSLYSKLHRHGLGNLTGAED